MPTGITPATQVRVYDGSGPMLPTGFPQGKVVDDLDAWLLQLKQQGYSFNPSSV
jgi:hypothetical protein